MGRVSVVSVLTTSVLAIFFGCTGTLVQVLWAWLAETAGISSFVSNTG